MPLTVHHRETIQFAALNLDGIVFNLILSAFGVKIDESSMTVIFSLLKNCWCFPWHYAKRYSFHHEADKKRLDAPKAVLRAAVCCIAYYQFLAKCALGQSRISVFRSHSLILRLYRLCKLTTDSARRWKNGWTNIWQEDGPSVLLKWRDRWVCKKCTNGQQTVSWKPGQTNGQLDRWAHGKLDERTEKQTSRPTNRRANGRWEYSQADGGTKARVLGKSPERTLHPLSQTRSDLPHAWSSAFLMGR